MTNAALTHNAPSPVSIIGTVEAARILGVDRSTVTRRVLAGELEPVGQLESGAYVFHRATVNAAALAARNTAGGRRGRTTDADATQPAGPAGE